MGQGHALLADIFNRGGVEQYIGQAVLITISMQTVLCSEESRLLSL
jgi:hypothetical protein